MSEEKKLYEYLQSVKELQIAYDKVREYGKLIEITGNYMNNHPYKMTVSNCKDGFPHTVYEHSLNGNYCHLLTK